MQIRFSPGIPAVVLIILVAFTAADRAFEDDGRSTKIVGANLAPAVPALLPSAPAAQTLMAGSPFIQGRVTTVAGDVYEGRIRFGGDEEALWSNYFNGFRPDNPWADYLPEHRKPTRRRAIRIFGFEIASSEEPLALGRPFMVRFGDIARIEASLQDIRVTLKSGTVHVLDRFSADDFADGVRIHDETRGVVEIGEWKIRSIEFLESTVQRESASDASERTPAPEPLYGTVHSREGSFTGLIQWDREACLSTDELVGYASGDEYRVPFSDIRRIARNGKGGARLTLADGEELLLSDSRDTGHGHRGMYVDDERYGRVLVSWDAFEHADFDAPPDAPSYGDYTAGRSLTGTVTTRTGQTIAGRLVFDLDESETIETLDAPEGGIDYTVPFGQISSVERAAVAASDDGPNVVTLASGETLTLESSGDLGDGNAGMLIFARGSAHPEYVSWAEIQRIDFSHGTVSSR